MTAAGAPEAKGAYPKTLNRQIHGLRGFSALAVYVFHVYGMATLWGFWPNALEPFKWFFIAGRHGVEIFFAISGYLITASLIRHGDARRFLIDRCIRIYPVFLTIHVLVFAVGPVIGYKWMAGIRPLDWVLNFISNALFLPGIFHLPLAQLNAATLSYEAAFYLFSAAAFVAARRGGRRPTAVAVVLLLIPIFIIYHKTVFFLVGALVHFIATRGQPKIPPILRAVSIPALILCLGLLAASEVGPIFLIHIAALPGFVFFWSIVDGRCALSAILRTRPLQYLGTVSYSFYLWAPVVTYPMKILVLRLFRDRTHDLAVVVLFGLVGLAVSLLVAEASYRILEDGAGKLLHRRLAARQAPNAVGQPA